MKKFLCIILAFVMLLGMVACSSEKGDGEQAQSSESAAASDTSDTTEGGDPNGDQGTPPEKSDGIPENAIVFGTDTAFLKLLDGRMEKTAEGITCDWSCAGIEFEAECEGQITLGLTVDAKNGCYFRIFVDGNEFKNGDSFYFECKSGDATITLNGIASGKHSFRIVKVTEYDLARSTLKWLSVDNGTITQTAPAENDTYVEFIGANSFSGYALIPTLWGSYTGAYTCQDGTLAVPYLVSNALNADYSVIALSEQGIVSGTPNLENAYKYASYLRNSETEFGFTRKADAVVIDAGIVDAMANKGVSEDQFTVAYSRLLEYVRTKHGDDCVILSVYNIAGDGYGSAIKNVVKTLGGEDENYYILKTDRCGAVNTAYPTIEENLVYSQVIGTLVSSILEGTYEPPVYDTAKVSVSDTTLSKDDMPNVSWGNSEEPPLDVPEDPIVPPTEDPDDPDIPPVDNPEDPNVPPTEEPDDPDTPEVPPVIVPDEITLKEDILSKEDMPFVSWDLV